MGEEADSEGGVTDYEHQLARARRNFALCVLQIQAPSIDPAADEAVRREWRKKADRLKGAIAVASTITFMCGDMVVARASDILKQENEPR